MDTAIHAPIDAKRDRYNSYMRKYMREKYREKPDYKYTTRLAYYKKTYKEEPVIMAILEQDYTADVKYHLIVQFIASKK